MQRIKLFLMRHSKSCSNRVRSDKNVNNVELSQEIRDPDLSVDGERVARLYGPVLRKKLVAAGLDMSTTLIASSVLRRAQETAEIIFKKKPILMPCFTENGNIPENTPTTRNYEAPDWTRFSDHIATMLAENKDARAIAVVGHGSYLKSLWPTLTGNPRKDRLNNLDGILLEVDVEMGNMMIDKGHMKIYPRSHHEILCPEKYRAKEHGDQCQAQDELKIAALRRKMTQKKQKRQKGGNGSTGMPLAYFQDGAQMRGTFGEPTGVGLTAASGNWIRPALSQTGGRRSRSQRNQRKRSQRKRSQRNQRSQSRSQAGGFSPSIMGGFATVGMRALPVATYLGYKMYSNKSKSKSKRQTKKRQH